MRSRSALGALFSGALFGVLFAGCGGGDETTGAGGAGGDSAQSSTSAQSSSSSVASSTASSSSTGGMMGDGNNTIETAEPIELNNTTPYEGDLDPLGDEDFYQFEGKSGQALYIGVSAEGIDNVRFDPAYIDTIVTLYDATGEQIAESNNGVPLFNADAGLLTMLPADGTYYLRVTDCFTWSKNPSSQCQLPEEKDNTYYELNVFELDPAFEGITADTEQGNDASSADAIEYAKSQTGNYFISEVYGTFTDKADVDVFSFNMPADIPSQAGTRPTGYYYLIPPGKSGSGSTTAVGRMYITELATPLVPIAEIYGSQNAELSPPLETGKDYLLFIEHPDLAYEPQDFYFVRHYAGYANPLEADDVKNNDVMTPDPIAADSNGDGSFSAFIEGDLLGGAADVDHFIATVPPTVGDTGTLTAVCSALRRGSGLRSMTIAILNKDGSVIVQGTQETTSAFARAQNVDIPAGATEIVVKLTATQDPLVTSSFYRCGVHFNP